MSRPMLPVCIALVLGIVLAAQYPAAGPALIRIMIPVAVCAFAAAGLAPGLIGARRAGVICTVFLLIGMFLLGSIRWYAGAASIRSLALVEGERREVSVGLRVVQPAQPSSYRGFRWRGEVYDVVAHGSDRLSVGALVEAYSEEQPRPGDEITVRGEVFLPWAARNPGEFDYRQLLLRQGIGYLLSADEITEPLRASRSFRTALLRLRSAVTESILQRLSTPAGDDAAAVVVALLTGERDYVSDELQDDFRTAGLAHLLAISGLHVMAVGGGVRAVLSRFTSRVHSDLVAVAVILLYAVFAGGRPSVTRAALLFGAQIGAGQLRRRSDPLNLLATCACLMLLQNPHMVFDVGFQMSFGAFWSLVSLRPVIMESLPCAGTRAIRSALSVGISVWLVIFPLSLYHFGSASWLGLVVNPVITPLFFFIFLSVQLTAIAALVGLPSELLHLLCRPLSVFLGVVRVLGLLPGEIGLEICTPVLLWIVATLLAVGRTSFRRPLSPVPLLRFGSLGRRRTFVSFVAWVLVSILLIISPGGGSNLLRVTVFDVGQGDCILVEKPGGETLLIDTGPPFFYSEGAVAEEAVWPYLDERGIDELDHLVLTHGHLDHTGGASALLQRVGVGKLWLGPMCEAGARLECEPEISAAVKEMKIPVRRAISGQKIGVAGVEVKILWPETDVPGFFDLNEASTALRVSYGQWSMLCMGDVEGLGERAVVDLYGDGLNSVVLKVGHHGSDAGSEDAFLQYVSPQVAVIPTGPNPYGHPSAATVARLEAHGAMVLTTEKAGAVIFETDGANYRVMSMIPVSPAAGQEVGESVGKLEASY